MQQSTEIKRTVAIVIRTSRLQKAIHNFRDYCCHLVKTNFGPAGHHRPLNPKKSEGNEGI
jgi:hypothetical protein